MDDQPQIVATARRRKVDRNVPLLQERRVHGARRRRAGRVRRVDAVGGAGGADGGPRTETDLQKERLGQWADFQRRERPDACEDVLCEAQALVDVLAERACAVLAPGQVQLQRLAPPAAAERLGRHVRDARLLGGMGVME